MATSIYYPSPQNELEVRANIVLKYFLKWSKQLTSTIKQESLEEKFAFVDLSASWGLDQHHQSIATKVLQLAAKNRFIREMLSIVINDKQEETVAQITESITKIDLIETFTFPPNIYFSEVNKDVLGTLSTIKTLPTLVLLDLYNYEGIHLNLVHNLVYKSNADCLLLFDYKSIYNSINKKKKEAMLLRIFGSTITHQLKVAFKEKLPKHQKESIILDAFQKRLIEVMGDHLLHPPLRYKFYDAQNKTSHFLFFLTTNKTNYALMREIFRTESQIIEDGIGNLEYNPNKGPQQKITSQTLFGSMFNLEQELLQTYKSQTLQIIDIYENHHSNKALVKKNYIDALLNLERKNKITVTRKRQRMRPHNHIGLNDNIFVSFNK